MKTSANKGPRGPAGSNVCENMLHSVLISFHTSEQNPNEAWFQEVNCGGSFWYSVQPGRVTYSTEPALVQAVSEI